MRTFTLLAVLLATFSLVTPQTPGQPSQDAASTATVSNCGPIGTSHTRTTLFFGLARPRGNVSGAQWKTFLRTEVTPRFPQGFTVWNADGQWRRADGRIIIERSKVLLLVHDESPKSLAAIHQIVERYKAMFQQEAVLWETARVCAAF